MKRKKKSANVIHKPKEETVQFSVSDVLALLPQCRSHSQAKLSLARLCIDLCGNGQCVMCVCACVFTPCILHIQPTDLSQPHRQFLHQSLSVTHMHLTASSRLECNRPG